MGTTTTRLDGARERFSGKVKTALGRLLADPRLQLAGRATELKGAAKQGFAKTLGWSRGALQSVMGSVMRGTGKATGSADMEAAGAVKQAEGETRQTLNS